MISSKDLARILSMLCNIMCVGLGTGLFLAGISEAIGYSVIGGSILLAAATISLSIKGK